MSEKVTWAEATKDVVQKFEVAANFNGNTVFNDGQVSHSKLERF